jgi:hypothetical protein
MCIVQDRLLRPSAGESGLLSESTHYSGLHGGHGQGLSSTPSTGAPSISYPGAALLESPLHIPPHPGSYVDVSSSISYQKGSALHAIPRRMLYCDPASQVSAMDSGNVLFGPEEYQDILDAQVTWHSTVHFYRTFRGSPYLPCRRRS